MKNIQTVADDHADDEGELRDIPTRQAALPAATRDLHRAVLRTFLDTGNAPNKRDFIAAAESLGLNIDAAFRMLADVDLVHLGPDDAITVAYPFSGCDTGIRVRWPAGHDVQAMCAVDALGIPQMAGHDAVITATDPHDRQPVRVETFGRQWSWQPADAVVLLGRRKNVSGPTAACACPVITFHTSAQSASDHLAALAALSGVRGRVLFQDEACELAGKLFGGLLRDRPAR
jgi:alkylmercury lyase-like protein